MRLLLEWRADPRAADERGWTPFHWAVKLRNKEAAKLLLESEVDVDSTNEDKQAALHFASIEGEVG
jgi:ankyrin repeat protein